MTWQVGLILIGLGLIALWIGAEINSAVAQWEKRARSCASPGSRLRGSAGPK